jgi:hypothetical protein
MSPGMSAIGKNGPVVLSLSFVARDPSETWRAAGRNFCP